MTYQHDTVWFKCPKCSANLYTNSQAGFREGRQYGAGHVPGIVAYDISRDEIWCDTCAISYRVQTTVPDFVECKLVQK